MEEQLADLIRLTIQHHSYHISERCLDELTDKVIEFFRDDVEKAWMYDELVD